MLDEPHKTTSKFIITDSGYKSSSKRGASSKATLLTKDVAHVKVKTSEAKEGQKEIREP